MMKRFALFSLVLLILNSNAALAQEDAHAHHSIGYVPREVLNRPVALREGTGRVHEEVTTKSKEAQAFYDQGLAYLHSYVWVEAARSFNHALRLDPKMAMAYVGLSRAYSGLDDHKSAREVLAKAQSLQSSASAREQRRIHLRLLQLDAIDDIENTTKHLAYKRAIDDALAVDLNDSELWLLRGNAEESTAAGRGQRGGAASVAFYNQAMKVSPDNFAAHHYLTHSYETIGNIELALRHGEAYARLSYGIPHAHHMFGHDLRRVGRIEDAIAAFRRADELEHAYYKTENVRADYDWHHQHNLDLLSTSYQYMGQMKTAERLMREALSLETVSEGREFNKREWPGFLLSRGRKEESLAAARELARGKFPGGRAVGHVFAGHALLAMNKIAEAQSELAAAERLTSELPRVGPFVTQSTLSPYLNGLRGEILLREGKREEGSEMLKGVMRRLRATPGPDAWSQALFRLEAIARVAREVGDWQFAEYVARQMLEHDAAYAGTHYALALVAERKGDHSTAQKEFALALKYWQKADADLPEVADARAKIASSGK
jgi:tetratricopeptide (TPR) repeat protein